jgi:hypothetical protein
MDPSADAPQHSSLRIKDAELQKCFVVNKRLAPKSALMTGMAFSTVQLYLKSGLDEPQEVLDATKAYRAREDIIGRWMTECGFIFDAELKVEAKELINSWQETRDTSRTRSIVQN